MSIKKMIYNLSKDGVIFQVYKDDQSKINIKCGDQDNITCVVGDSNEDVFLKLASHISKLTSEKSAFSLIKPLIQDEDK